MNIGPYRVWLKNIDIPGLAMSRSMGDKIGVQAGVIGDPEIMEFIKSDDDRFMIIASDGVWEYMTNNEVLNVVRPYYLNKQVDLACKQLVIAA